MNLNIFLQAETLLYHDFTFWAAAPKGPMTHAFTYAEIYPPSPAPPLPPPSPRGPNPSLEAQIPVSRLKSQPQGANPSLKAFGGALGDVMYALPTSLMLPNIVTCYQL